MTHTPTPYRVTGSEVNTSMWIVDAKNRRICTIKTCDHDNDNAAFIVRCCNSHDELVKALEAMIHCETAYERATAYHKSIAALAAARGEA